MRNIYKLKNSQPHLDKVLSETIYQIKFHICKQYQLALIDKYQSVINQLKPHCNEIKLTFWYYDCDFNVQFYKPL